MMSYSEFQKTQKKHMRCVVCGHGFSSDYNPDIRAFPVYHPDDEKFQCENKFFKALLHIYLFIHRTRASISMNALMSKFDWRVTMLMKKEFMKWCMCRGYLDTDNLNRLQTPKEVTSSCKEMFEHLDVNNPEELERAVQMIRTALEYMAKELRPDAETLAEKAALLGSKPKQKDKPDPHKIPVMGSKKQPTGMATAERTGAKGFGVRNARATQRPKAV